MTLASAAVPEDGRYVSTLCHNSPGLHQIQMGGGSPLPASIPLWAGMSDRYCTHWLPAGPEREQSRDMAERNRRFVDS